MAHFRRMMVPWLPFLAAWPRDGARAGSQPHLVYILADDFGWADADWHRPSGWSEAATPRMLKEVRQEGIELDSMYSFKFCAPSRSAIQSGRNPIYVNVQNYQPTTWASDAPLRDPDAGYAGIPRNMTGIASVLRTVGYQTHFVGKWDCGMATKDHTPSGRGYDTSLFCEPALPLRTFANCAASPDQLGRPRRGRLSSRQRLLDVAGPGLRHSVRVPRGHAPVCGLVGWRRPGPRPQQLGVV